VTRRKFATLLTGIWTVVLLAACGSSESTSPATDSVADSGPAVSPPAVDATTFTQDWPRHSEVDSAGELVADPVAPRGAITVTVGTAEFFATLADTPTARAFAERLPLTLDMRDVNNNEKAFELAETLPGVAANPGTVNKGDLMLYGSSTIVLFYESFDTSYAYSRIGRLDNPDGLAKVLGAGDVTVTFAHPHVAAIVRKWAVGQGIKVSPRGRVAADVVAQHEAANAPRSFASMHITDLRSVFGRRTHH
jgi:hypothetical protein